MALCCFNASDNFFNYSHSLTPCPDNIAVHIHDHYEIYYFLAGDVTYYIEGQAYTISPNELLIISNRELHRPHFNSNCNYERVTIHFKPEYVSGFQNSEYDLLYFFKKRKLGHHNKVSITEIQKYNIHAFFTQIEQYIHNQKPQREVMIKTLFVQLLVALNQVFAEKKDMVLQTSEYDEKIFNILAYINNHLHEKITLDLLEQKFFVNKYYLCHIFKKNTGFTVMEYVTYKRIMKAKELLALHTPVIETCHAVGFNDYSNFYKVFKRLVGTSPREFAK